jgi:hypothetical protein
MFVGNGYMRAGRPPGPNLTARHIYWPDEMGVAY